MLIITFWKTKYWFLFYSRDGKAIRLSYDHKATDPEEMKRIKAKNGWVVQDKVAGIVLRIIWYFIELFMKIPKL